MPSVELSASQLQRLGGYVRHLLPKWMPDKAEDLTQVAAVRVIRTGQLPLSNKYLYRVAYCVVIDEIRRHRYRYEVPMTPSLPGRLANSLAENPEIFTQGSEIGVAIVDCLETLAPERKRAVLLHLQSHKTADVARVMGCKPKRASNLVHRGLKDLRTALTRRGFTP